MSLLNVKNTFPMYGQSIQIEVEVTLYRAALISIHTSLCHVQFLLQQRDA